MKFIDEIKYRKKAIIITASIIVGLVLLMLPYVITKSEGFFYIIALPSLFICMILSFVFGGIALLAALYAILRSFGALVAGDGAEYSSLAIGFGVALLSLIPCFGLSLLLESVDFTNAVSVLFGGWEGLPWNNSPLDE
jgi:hypothetical protein